jgi:hypothetical protein
MPLTIPETAILVRPNPTIALGNSWFTPVTTMPSIFASIANGSAIDMRRSINYQIAGTHSIALRTSSAGGTSTNMLIGNVSGRFRPATNVIISTFVYSGAFVNPIPALVVIGTDGGVNLYANNLPPSTDMSLVLTVSYFTR